MPELTVDLVERFYAILAVVAIAGVVIVILLRILAIQSDPALDAYAAIARAIQARGIVAAWLVALLATAGSLYFSEVARFTPCTLCWYQRIAMYPLVVILGAAILRRQRSAPAGSVALAAVGAVIAAYHVALEWIPALDTGACAASVPCTDVWFRVFGIFSLPTLALTAFLLIMMLLVVRDPDEADRWRDR
ncbi:MAG TPA: disulfide oxidoreductase [Candidatus Limnocylindrales bacterium]|nr:disulfide oxidoreductase [Candidatus Limnocylindrales bacterium]